MPEEKTPAERLKPRPKHRLLRLSLRGLLLGMVLLSVSVAWFANRAYSQRKSVAAVREAGGWVYYDINYSDGVPSRGSGSSFLPNGKSSLPSWLVDGIGFDIFHRVVNVDMIHNPHLRDEHGRREAVDYKSTEWSNYLLGLPALRKLSIKGGQVDDSVLARIGQLNELEELSIVGTDSTAFLNQIIPIHPGISNDGLAKLVKCKALRNVDIVWCDLDDDSLELFATLPLLERLNITGIFSADAIRSICERFPNARIRATPNPYLPKKNGE